MAIRFSPGEEGKESIGGGGVGGGGFGRGVVGSTMNNPCSD